MVSASSSLRALDLGILWMALCFFMVGMEYNI